MACDDVTAATGVGIMTVSPCNNVIYDGDVFSGSDARLSLFTRLAMYGEGCFDTLRSYNGSFLHPERHLKRIQAGLSYLGTDIPEALSGVEPFLLLLSRFLEANSVQDRDVRIRIQVWADDHTTGYRPGNRSARYIVTGKPVDSGLLSPDEKGLADGVSLITSRIRRIPSDALPSEIKWTNGINYILAAREAQGKNADDALMLTQTGHVSETTIANIFWKKGSAVFTPSLDCDLLPGITREMLIGVLQQAGISVETGRFTLDELLQSDMVWACNSIRELYSVHQIDQTNFSPDELFWKEMCRQFEKHKKEALRYVR